MADATKFDHDQIGHLLADMLLEVPEFQRKYSWTDQNVKEYLADLQRARQGGGQYFVGTVVFVLPSQPGGRATIVDGQQRLATTSILLIAIRDLLAEYGKARQAKDIQDRFLYGYEITVDEDIERLHLSPADQDAYDELVHSLEEVQDPSHPVRVAYDICLTHLREIAPRKSQFKTLIEVAGQLEHKVQVLTAAAVDLSEAYVIFETLNDRGADLTIADLLKNFLFSASKGNIEYVKRVWIELEASFSKPEDLVKFIRYDYISRNGSTQTRSLYRAIQQEVGSSSAQAKAYAKRLKSSAKVYLAIREPESDYWGDTNNEDIVDALTAYRRLGLESSMPVMLAASATRSKVNATKLMVKIVNWSIRALFVGRLGAKLAEATFGETARAISAKEVKTQTEIHAKLEPLLPADDEFVRAFAGYGDLDNSRAKYLLAMLERAYARSQSIPPSALSWTSTAVTVEHILAKSDESSEGSALRKTIGNLTLLQRKGNRDLDLKPFADKRVVYAASEFPLTKLVAENEEWSKEEILLRTNFLADLAKVAWPDN